MSKILIGLEGGAGKHITVSAVIKQMHEEGHEVHVMAAWPQILQGNPYIARLHEWQRSEYLIERFNEYDQVILDDPYRQRPFLQGELNLAQTWFWMWDGRLVSREDAIPDYWITLAEEQEINSFVQGIEKPIMVVQTNGGQHQGWAWTKDIPLPEAAQVLNHFTEEYEIIHLRQKGQPQIEGIKHTEELSIRQCIALLARSKKRFLIDSYAQHAAAALNLPSTVYWAATKPEQFGYDLHTNIESYEPTLKNQHRLEMLFSGLDHSSDKCPFSAGQRLLPLEETMQALRV